MAQLAFSVIIAAFAVQTLRGQAPGPEPLPPACLSVWDFDLKTKVCYTGMIYPSSAGFFDSVLSRLNTQLQGADRETR